MCVKNSSCYRKYVRINGRIFEKDNLEKKSVILVSMKTVFMLTDN